MFKLHWFLMSFSQLSIILLTFSPELISFFYWYGYYDNFVNALNYNNNMMWWYVLLIVIATPIFDAFNTKYCLEQYKAPDQPISFIKAIPSFKALWKYEIYFLKLMFWLLLKYILWSFLIILLWVGVISFILFINSYFIDSDMFAIVLYILSSVLIYIACFLWLYKKGPGKKIIIANIYKFAVHSNYIVDLNLSNQYAKELISGYEKEFWRLRKHNIKISFIGFLCFGIGYIPAVAYSTLTEIIFFSKLEKLKFDNNKNQNHI